MTIPNLWAGKRPAIMALAVGAAAVLAISLTASVHAAPPQSTTAYYIVQTVSEPVANYNGGTVGFARTKPAGNAKLNAHSNAAKQWLQKLRDEHKKVLADQNISETQVAYHYGVVFNGFAVKLTEAEAARLKKATGVVQVWENETHYADTTTTRDFLELSGKHGAWKKQFGGSDRAGEGVIVGIIDTGIWPENPAFAALPEPRPDQGIIDDKWNGTCDTGPEMPVPCNNKLIGARYFNEAIGDPEDFEFESARDHNGHGTHTASTSAGNFGVPASINGYDVGTTSGMAPVARIAVYKGLWSQPDGGGSGTTADLAAAIDAAVSDGVDVINYSISGSRNFIVTPVDISFLFAADAGVFISTSAGNSGSSIGASSVAHNAPWTTTVAASTHDRGNQKTVTLGNGASYTGVGVVPPAVALSPLVDSETIPAAGWTADDARLCIPGSLDPAGADGKIVICTRGAIARVDKSKAVADAGGVGMVHANTSAAESLNGDWHSVPTVHVGPDAGNAIKAYAATTGATAELSEADTSSVKAPQMAAFSSYGPAVAGGGDLLKPDITAPGVDVIASVSPASDTNDFNALSGTSMSAPHVAGIAALLRSKHQDWSPMRIKSAMMTTASTTDNEGDPIQWAFGDATPLNYGAGHVTPKDAFSPGLVYDSGWTDWISYGCAIGQFQLITSPAFCESYPTIDPSDLNYPSISVADLAGSQTVTRTVTNVASKPGFYFAKVDAPAGFKVKVSPWLMLVKPGESKTYTVEITRTSAPVGDWSFGSLTWQGVGFGWHQVTSPIAVRPVALAAPTEVTLSGDSGSSDLNLTSGFDGTLTADVAGLAEADVTELVFTEQSTVFDPNDPETAKKVTVVVPEGSALVRFATYDADVPAGTDVDLFAFRDGELVASSGGGTSEESMTLTTPGSYDVYVHMFAFTDTPPITVPHHAYVIPGTASGNLTASPPSQDVATGGDATVTLDWTGLTPGSRYLGIVSYGDGDATIGRTIVGVLA